MSASRDMTVLRVSGHLLNSPENGLHDDTGDSVRVSIAGRSPILEVSVALRRKLATCLNL
jgi:hypothetical protein